MNLIGVLGRCCALGTIGLLVVLSVIPAAIVRGGDVDPPGDGSAPTGDLVELAIDDGVPECVGGSGVTGLSGFGWANKLTPTSYPATLRAVTIGINQTISIGREVPPEAHLRIVVFKDPEMDGPENLQAPDATFFGRTIGRGQFMTFNLITPVSITEGSFVVGVIDEFGVSGLPAFFDIPGRSNPPGSESFVTFNRGGTWRTQAEVFGGPGACNPTGSAAGSWLIRATIETGPARVFDIGEAITDPEAVEPWDIATDGLGATAFVTNLVSDSLTIIDTLTNEFENLSVGDGPGGVPDGPFGVVARPDGGRVYVTLFGSNTVPSKEFPVDYDEVGPGRVLVLGKQEDGSYDELVQISVGKGPRYPAILPDGSKLYVPCGDVNRVDVVNTATNEKISEIPVGTDPSSCTLSLDGLKLYVTNFGDGSISVIDTRTDVRIRDIPAPLVALPGVLDPSFASNPWSGTVSPANGYLYVAYWGTEGDLPSNGALAEFDTCSDQFIRTIVDDTTVGTEAGAAGADGNPALEGPLIRDPDTGQTVGAGGGGGGIFSVSSGLTQPLTLFTNDGRGLIGALDPRIGQVVSAPPITPDNGPKPRGVSLFESSSRRFGIVAVGQPLNSVLLLSLAVPPENIASLPVVDSVEIKGKVKIRGRGFNQGLTIEFIAPGSPECLSFERAPKFKQGRTLIIQPGVLTNGRKPKQMMSRGSSALIRITTADGVVRVFRATRT